MAVVPSCCHIPKLELGGEGWSLGAGLEPPCLARSSYRRFLSPVPRSHPPQSPFCHFVCWLDWERLCPGKTAQRPLPPDCTALGGSLGTPGFPLAHPWLLPQSGRDDTMHVA